MRRRADAPRPRRARRRARACSTIPRRPCSATSRTLAARAARPLVVLFDEADGLVGAADGLVPDPAPRRLHRPRGRPRSRTASCSSASATCATTCSPRRSAAPSRWLGTTSPFNITAEAASPRPLHPRRGRGAPRPAHRRDRAALRARGRGARSTTLSQGHPWLVNALADRDRRARLRDRTRRRHRRARRGRQGGDHPRAAHAHRLAGGAGCASRGCAGSSTRCSRASDAAGDVLDDDFAYVLGLGLIRAHGGALRDRQPHLPRGAPARAHLRPADADRRRAARPSCAPTASLDMPKLMAAWQTFWREDGHLAAEGFGYRESGPAPDADGVPPAHRERRRPDRARVRARPRARSI